MGDYPNPNAEPQGNWRTDEAAGCSRASILERLAKERWQISKGKEQPDNDNE